MRLSEVFLQRSVIEGSSSLAREGVRAISIDSSEVVLAVRRCNKGEVFVKFDLAVNYRHLQGFH